MPEPKYSLAFALNCKTAPTFSSNIPTNVLAPILHDNLVPLTKVTTSLTVLTAVAILARATVTVVSTPKLSLTVIDTSSVLTNGSADVVETTRLVVAPLFVTVLMLARATVTGVSPPISISPALSKTTPEAH